ncbi:hypothetical protein FRC09_012683, partial [Ceratobasidium sp. 395]
MDYQEKILDVAANLEKVANSIVITKNSTVRTETAISKLGEDVSNAAKRSNEALNATNEVLNNLATLINGIREPINTIEENVRELPFMTRGVTRVDQRTTDIEEILKGVEQRVTDLLNATEESVVDQQTLHLTDAREKADKGRGRERTREGPRQVRHANRSRSEQTPERIEFMEPFDPKAESTTRHKNQTKAKAKAEVITSFMHQTTAAGKDIPKGARTKIPDSFNGKRGKEAQTFITKMGLYFTDVEEGTFNDNRKIVQTLLNMTGGNSANWAQPLLIRIEAGEEHKLLQ